MRTPGRRTSGFTMLEMMIAISILSLIVAAIYSSWTAILRASKVGLESTARVQRARIVVRVLEDSLGSVMSFAQNQNYYSFVAVNGSDASLSFVARLAKSFPRSGKFGDLDVRRLTFAVEGGGGSRSLVLRQTPILLDIDEDEQQSPLVLAENVKEFSTEFWDARRSDWVEEWTQTNQIPKLVRVTLELADNPHSTAAREPIVRVISLPSVMVQPGWQRPMMPGQTGPGGGGVTGPGGGAAAGGTQNSPIQQGTQGGGTFRQSPGTGGRP